MVAKSAVVLSETFISVFFSNSLSNDIQTDKDVAIKLQIYKKSLNQEFAKCKFTQLLYKLKLYRILQGGGFFFLITSSISSIFSGNPQSSLGWSGRWFQCDGFGIRSFIGVEDLFIFCGRKFELKTVSIFADQILSRIKFFHSKNLLYRDIKPDNFVIGSTKTRTESI